MINLLFLLISEIPFGLIQIYRYNGERRAAVDIANEPVAVVAPTYYNNI